LVWNELDPGGLSGCDSGFACEATMSADPMSQLFTSALGLPSPWRVEKVRFEQAVNEIHFEVVCDAQPPTARVAGWRSAAANC
jgi:hypothetical protein